MAQRALAELPPELHDERNALEAVELISVYFGADVEGALERSKRRRHEPFGDGPGAKMLQATVAFGWMIDAGDADAASELALNAMEGGTLLEADNGVFWMGAMLTLVVADRPETLPLWEQTMAQAHRNGSLFSRLSVTLWDGCLKLVRGELAEAEESLLSNLAMIKSYGINVPQASSYSYAFLGGVYLEMGDVEARAAARSTACRPPRATSPTARTSLAARSIGLHMADGNGDAALEAAEELERHSSGTRNPRWMPWRSLKGQALAMLGRREEAIALAEEEVAIAREWGTPSGLGHSLRVLGELRGPEGLEELEEAADAAGALGPAHRARTRLRGARRGAAARTPAHRRPGAAAARARAGGAVGRAPPLPRTCAPSSTPPARGRARPRWTAWSRSPSESCAWRPSPPTARPIATSPRRST